MIIHELSSPLLINIKIHYLGTEMFYNKILFYAFDLLFVYILTQLHNDFGNTLKVSRHGVYPAR